MPEISELSTGQVIEESALINHSKKQNLQPEEKISANETQPPEKITEQSPPTAVDPLPQISELSTEQVIEESALINNPKEQNLQPEEKISANETQQDEHEVQITGNLPMS